MSYGPVHALLAASGMVDGIKNDYYIENDGCWLWMGSVDHKGYGVLRSQPVHKLFYERKYGPVPVGMELHHKCEIKRCCNPDCVKPVTKGQHRKTHAKIFNVEYLRRFA